MKSTYTKRRAPTAAQAAASKKAWASALGTVTGRYRQGTVVADWSGQCWRLTRPGRRYHEDVEDAIYPAVPCRAPAAWRRSEELRAIREGLFQGRPEEIAAPPAPEGERIVWTDRTPGSLAEGPSLSVQGEVVSAYRPVYDDSGVAGWRQDARLAARVRRLIAAQPAAVHLPRVHVTLRGAAAAARAVGAAMRALTTGVGGDPVVKSAAP